MVVSICLFGKAISVDGKGDFVCVIYVTYVVGSPIKTRRAYNYCKWNLLENYMLGVRGDCNLSKEDTSGRSHISQYRRNFSLSKKSTSKQKGDLDPTQTT
jgi:hypothetical protein